MTYRAATAIDNATAMTAEAAQMAVEAGLRYVSCFYYLTPENRRLTSANELKRIVSLAVPPAYKNVWICVNPRGHLQATGQDARGRKQYRYHPHWRQARDNAKFDRMIAFGEALPKLRRKLTRDLALPGLPREKVLAAVAAAMWSMRATTRVSD
jgi:DNA topoisomerase-1